jgi:hypothetical protein
MPKLVCECGTERFFTDGDLRAAAGQPFKCPKCGKVRKLPQLTRREPEQPQVASNADVHLDGVFAEIEAVDQTVSAPAPAPLSPFAAAVQEELSKESGILLLELWANGVVLGCYLLSAVTIVCGVIVFRRADSVTQEIYALLCWLFALIALGTGCSIQILLEICRRMKAAEPANESNLDSGGPDDS